MNVNHRARALAIVLTGFFNASCAFETLEPCEGKACEELGATGQPSIFGADDRVEYSAASTRQKGWADAVAGLTPSSAIQCPSGTSNCTINLDSSLGATGVSVNQVHYPMCSGESYMNQLTSPPCSAFLVGPDLMATAGHCFDSQYFGANGDDSLSLAEAQSACTQMSVVFGFTAETINGPVATVPATNRYTCKTVREAFYDLPTKVRINNVDYPTNKRDWALFQLDRVVTGRAPHAFRRTGRIAPREQLTVVGHPWGLPLKIAAGGQVQKVTIGNQMHLLWSGNVLFHSTDTQVANSGSPLINSGTGMVEGIHIASPGSFAVDSSANPPCARWMKCSTSGCTGTNQWGEAIRTERLKNLVPSIAPKLFEQRTATVSAPFSPFSGDFDGDGESDVYWFGPGGAADAVSWGTSSRTFTAGTDTTSQDYKPFTGDFDRDGFTDIFWYGPGIIQDRVSWGNAARTFGSSTITNTMGVALPNTSAAVYTPRVGDFDGDGYFDIFWYAPGAGVDLQWYGTASRKFEQKTLAIAGTYDSLLVGDFNGDKRSDLFWYSRTGVSRVSFGTAARGFTTVDAKDKGSKSLPTTTWTSLLVGDFDGDSRSDIYFYASGATTDLQWFGTTDNSFNAMADQTTIVYKPIVGDFNGDALDDIFWYSETTTDKVSWGSAGRNFPTANQPFALAAGYRLFRGDFDGNSTADIYAYVATATKEQIFYGMMKP